MATPSIELDGVVYDLVRDERGNPVFSQERIDYRVPQFASGAVTSQNLPSSVAEVHEINSYVDGFAVNYQVPGEPSRGILYGKNVLSTNSSGLRASAASRQLGFATPASHFVEFRGDLYAATGSKLLKITSEFAVSTVASLPYPIADLEVFNDRIFIAVEGVVAPYYVWDGSRLAISEQRFDASPLMVLTSQDSGASWNSRTVGPFAFDLPADWASWNQDGDLIVVGCPNPPTGIKISIPANPANSLAASLTIYYWSKQTSIWRSTSVEVSLATTAEIDLSDAIDFEDMGTLALNGIDSYPLMIGKYAGIPDTLVATNKGAAASDIPVADVALRIPLTAQSFLGLPGTLNAEGDVIYRATKHVGRPSIIKSLDSGAVWGGILTFGKKGEQITSLHDLQGRVVSETDRNVYTFAADFSSLVQALLGEQHNVTNLYTKNGERSLTVNNGIYMTRNRALYFYIPESTETQNIAQIGPETLPDNGTPVQGEVTALAYDTIFLYAALFDGQDTWILQLPLNLHGVPSNWHTWVHLPGTRIDALFIHAVGDSQYLVHSAGYIKLLRHNAPGPFVERWSAWMPRTISNVPQFPTVFLRVNVSVDGVDAANYINLSYRTSAEPEWRALGRVDDPAVTTFMLPLESQQKAQWFDMRLDSRNAADKTPVVRSVGIEYRKAFPFHRRFAFAVEIPGGTGRESALETIEALDTLIAAGNGVRFVAPTGQRFQVLVDDGKMDFSQFSGIFDFQSVRVLELTELATVETQGTWFDLEGYSWADLSGQSWQSLETYEASG